MGPTEPKDRLKALREAVGLRQSDLADGSGGRLNREEVNKLERGKVGFGSNETHRGLAHAFGLLVDDFSAYLDGELTIERALQLIEDGKLAGPARRSSPRLRDRENWERESAEARRIFRIVPESYIEQVGRLVDTLKCKLDAQLIGEMARSIFEAEMRGQDDMGPTSVSVPTASEDFRKKGSGLT